MSEISFTLNGKQYELSSEQVEERLLWEVPRPTEKYFVMLRGRPFPPKQVVSVALKLSPVKFTTMAANSILSRLGYEVEEESGQRQKTESERLFESLLSSRGLEFFFEPEIQGFSQRPDYVVPFGQNRVFLEVKEYQPIPEDYRTGGGAYDPYDPIRSKIQDGLKNLAGLRSQICAIVLYNAGKPLVDLRWQFIYSAMLGRLSYSFPFNVEKGVGDPDQAKIGFTGGAGEMVHYDKDGLPIEPYKRRISAVIALERLNIGKRRFAIAVHRRQAEIGRELTLEEYIEMANNLGTIRSIQELRVVVCSNPYALTDFPEDLFGGPYDECYGKHENHIQRKSIGEQLRKLEEEEEASGVVNRAPWTKLAKK